MDNKNTVLIILLIASLSLNAYGLIHIDQVEKNLGREFQAQADMVAGRINNLAGQISSINSQISNMNREQAWLLSQEFSVDTERSTAAGVYLNLDFTLREVADGARAQVHYRVADSLDWTTVEAGAIGGNTFRAELTVQGNNDYRYKIQVEDRVDEEKAIPRHYYVSRPVIPEISGIANRGDIQLDLMLVSSGSLILNPPVKVSLKYYQDTKLVKTEVLYQGQETGVFAGENTPWFGPYVVQFEDDLTHIDLEVIYEDGSIDEGEIWPGYEFMENLKSRGF